MKLTFSFLPRALASSTNCDDDTCGNLAAHLTKLRSLILIAIAQYLSNRSGCIGQQYALVNITFQVITPSWNQIAVEDTMCPIANTRRSLLGMPHQKMSAQRRT
jgi:hypothetical protein